MRRFVLLDIKDVSFGYLSGMPAVSEVRMDVEEHEIVTLLGPNGAGKSTLLKLVGGLLRCWTGSITYQGEQIDGVPAHDLSSRGLVMVPSERAVFVDQTVEENLLLGAYHHRADRRRVRRSLSTVLDRYPDLAKRARERAGRLSGGQQRMLAFARAEMARPRLLLLDEPTLGLSPIAAREVTQRIAYLRDLGVTVLMVEKRPNSVRELSDRVFVMDQGRVVLEGPTGQVLSDRRLGEYFLGQASQP